MSNKSIILTKTELKTIIKDTVNETLNSYQKNLMNDFRQIFHPASFDNPLTYLMRKPIEEGITKTYPIDITIRYINEYFNKYHLNVFIRKGSTLTKDEKIIIEFPNTNDNFNIINKALNLCGYYLGFPKEDEIIKNKNTISDILTFLEKEEKNVIHFDISQNKITIIFNDIVDDNILNIIHNICF